MAVLALSAQAQTHIGEGIWRGTLTLDENKKIEVPFTFNVFYADGQPTLTVFNAEERIVVEEVNIQNDSLFFKMPVFDNEFRCRLFQGLMKGVWINHSKNYSLPFTAVQGQTQRFKTVEFARNDFSGRWATTFNAGKADSSTAIGVFSQNKQLLSGTFLSETGDYRYLEGVSDGRSLYLSSFDGAHAFLFVATLDKANSDIIYGDFYSGHNGHETFKAIKNPNAQLRDPYTLTQTVKGKPVAFSFNNTEGQKISLTDERYKNKPVIIQIMGSWCPNCMDETAYLSQLYNQYQPKGLEIIALAYERTNDIEKAKNNVTHLKNKFGSQYEFLITGLSGAVEAQKSLPFLSSVRAFPTTIYLNKKHEVEKIYTGFDGPATGENYKKMQNNTENLINELLK